MKLTKLALTVGFMGATLLSFGGQANAVEVTHKIEAGETLSGIALKYFGDHNRFDELAKVNSIADANLIFAGNTLVINTETGEIKEEAPVAVEAPAAEVPAAEPVVTEVAETPVETPAPVVEAQPVQEAPVASYTSGSVQDIVRSAAAARGWDTGANWSAIDFIVQHESSWNPNAQNPTSTAYGLFQMLVETNSNPAVQAENGMNYIAGRYGTPLNALAFWQAHNWY